MRVLRAGLAAAIAAVLAVISAASPAFANGALAIGACGARARVNLILICAAVIWITRLRVP